ncbi:vascular endothelial growth factor C-like [Rhopalosiphum maidis]|uniref:vascular endothelial growth factor C-like n=1 Tax=Rhopalosiphum maidis TaxID=43146 RepID=UPI000EFDB61D|nr:vascular endothelial growth factor C-like [Rhopalosiphum maidis]
MFACTAPLSAAVVCCALLIVAVAARRGQNVARSTTTADWREDVVVHTTDGGRDTITSRGGSSCCDGRYAASTSSPSHNAVASPREIPLNVIVELNQVTNVSELFSKFMPDTNIDEAQTLFATTGFQSRSALNIERKSTLVPKPAGCSLELQTVSLKDTDDQSLYYYPTCTRVNRCGGCCAHDLMACQPIKVDTLNFEVVVSQYNEAGKFDFVGRKIVSIDQHLKCKCGCVVKQENCTPLQTYYPDECRCMCSNEEDRDKCIEENDLKLWNPATCTCQCREIKECTSGFGFNYNTCGCEALRQRIKNTAYEFNKNTYSLGGT